MSIVVDASLVLRLLLHDETAGATARAAVAGQDLHAPHLLDVEVASGLRQLVASEAVAGHRAAQALEDLAALRLERYPHRLMLPRVWQLRANLTAYDALYAALAETLGIPLLTCERGLATAPGPQCEREHLP